MVRQGRMWTARRSQFTMEFVMIFMLAMFVFLIMLGVIVVFVEDDLVAGNKGKMEATAENIKKNVYIAYDSPGNFRTDLDLRDSDFDIYIDSAEGGDCIVFVMERFDHSKYAHRDIPGISSIDGVELSTANTAERKIDGSCITITKVDNSIIMERKEACG